MCPLSRTVLVVGMLVVIATFSLRGEYLINTDLKTDIGGWHGDGELAYLNADGTEGAEGDPGVTTVIKIPMSSGNPHSEYQEFETHDTPTTLSAKVDVFASKDFQRSKFPEDYSIDWKPGGTWYWSALAIPNVDFWIRGSGSSYCYKLASLKPGAWTTVAAHFEGLHADEDRTMSFCVPCGSGVVYLKNPSVTP